MNKLLKICQENKCETCPLRDKECESCREIEGEQTKIQQTMIWQIQSAIKEKNSNENN